MWLSGRTHPPASLLATLVGLFGLAGSTGLGVCALQEPAAGSTPGDARQLWTHEDPKSIEHLALTSQNHLLLMTGDRVAVLDRDKGSAIWSRDDIRNCGRPWRSDLVRYRHAVRCNYLGKFDLGFDLVAGDPPLLVGHNPEDGHFVVIDASSGRTIYESDRSSPGKIMEYWYSDSRRQFVTWVETGSDRYVFASLGADGRPGWKFGTSMIKDLVWLGEPHDASILVHGKDRDNKRVVAEIDVTAGKAAWQAAGLLDEDMDGGRLFGRGKRWLQKAYSFPPPIADSDSSVVVFITKDGPQRLSRDGKLLWRAEALKGRKPSAIHSAEGMVFVADDKDVVGLDSSSGRVVWRHKGKSALAAIESYTRSVLVWSDESVILLNPKTGTSLWNREARLPELWNNGSWLTEDFKPDYSAIKSPKRIVGDVAYVAGPASLVSIDLRNGTAQRVAAYNFEGKVPVTSMEIVDGDFLLTAPDAIARFDRQGQPKFRKYYKSIGKSGGAKAGAVAGWLLNRNVTEQMMWETFQKRYRASADDERYAYFLYERPHGNADRRFGIICVERATGKELGAFWVNKRDPDILLDPASRTMFFQERDNLIRATRF